MKQKKLGGEISSIKNLFNRNVENSEVFRYVNMITSTNSFYSWFFRAPSRYRYLSKKY